MMLVLSSEGMEPFSSQGDRSVMNGNRYNLQQGNCMRVEVRHGNKGPERLWNLI